MAKEFAKGFYNSKAWKKCRAAFISKRVTIDGAICQHCGNRPGYIVDHIEELTPENINDPLVTLNHTNFQFLCLKCHTKKTLTRDRGPNILFDENGQPMPPYSES